MALRGSSPVTAAGPRRICTRFPSSVPYYVGGDNRKDRSTLSSYTSLIDTSKIMDPECLLLSPGIGRIPLDPKR